MKIKFAHLADCHLGAWRNENLNQIGYKAFETTIDKIIEENVDFVVISGDLFDVSNPKVDVIDLSVRELKRLKDNGIPVYGIMGSHDFSPSDKSMIRPLITAGLFVNISKSDYAEIDKIKLKFTQDPKTKIKITGLRARKRSLEIEDYEMLDLKSLEEEKGIKIFVLHTLLSELKPIEFKDMKSAPKSLLPQGFDYYAGGHLHKTVPERLRDTETPLKVDEKIKIIYPGCLTPVNFRELEQYKYGGFCIVSGEIDMDSQKSELNVKFIPIKVKEVVPLFIDCNNKSIAQAHELLEKQIENIDFEDKVVSIRIFGTLSSGKTYELRTNEILQKVKGKGAYEVLINKSALVSKEYRPISVPVGKTNEEIENTLIYEHAQKIKIKNISKKDIENKIHNLLSLLGKEREEGTKVKEYNEDLLNNFNQIFQLEEEGE
ncbi:MAG: exonuclease SbcCD subunit D [Promethearchaeota archaeon]